MSNTGTATRKDPQTDLDHEDFQLLDAFMSQVERTLKSEASDRNFAGTRFDRWRRDLPELVMSWEAADGLSRNVRILFEKTDVGQYMFTVESNVWKDSPNPRTGETMRQWTNIAIGRGEVALREFRNGKLVVFHAAQPLTEIAQQAVLIAGAVNQTRFTHTMKF